MSKTNEIIKTIRANKKLSQEKMAADLGVSSNYISLIENGRKKPGRKFLESISDTYGVPLLLLSRESLVPEARNAKERELRSRFLGLMDELERDFLSA